MNKLFAFLGCFLVFSPLWAQQTQESASMKELLFARKVKQVSQFVRRFNYAENGEGKRINFADYQALERQKSILALFDTAYIRRLGNSKTEVETVNQFVREITDEKNPVFLHLQDTNWYALAKVEAIYKKKPKILTLTFCAEMEKGVMSWVIGGVEPIMGRGKYDSGHFLNSLNHEQNFIELGAAMADTAYLDSYFPKNYQPDPLSFFYYSVRNGDLVVRHVSQLTIHFLSLKNWILVVQEINRQSTNSGWLITDLRRCEETEKAIYKQQKLYLR